MHIVVDKSKRQISNLVSGENFTVWLTKNLENGPFLCRLDPPHFIKRANLKFKGLAKQKNS